MSGLSFAIARSLVRSSGLSRVPIALFYNAHFQCTVAYRRNISHKSNTFTLPTIALNQASFVRVLFSYAISLATVSKSYITLISV